MTNSIKKLGLLMIALLLACLILFTGCDPVLPDENIGATYTPSPLPQGETTVIEIIYPNTEDTAVVQWTDQNIEIIDGNDVVEISGLSVTGLKPGTAVLKIEARANCAFMGIIVDRPLFSAEIEIEVE